MEKVIKIGEKNYKMKASALTQFTYKDQTGRKLLYDLKEILKITENGIKIDNFDIVDKISEIVLPISYVMIKEADKSQVEDYDGFLSDIDGMYDDDGEWITNVILLAVSPISRQLQKDNINSKQ